MPVDQITISAVLSDGRAISHDKPIYRCDVCGAMAMFGSPSADRKTRLWHCAAHKPIQEE